MWSYFQDWNGLRNLKSLKVKWKSLSCVPLFATPWTIPSREFPRPEHWSGVALPFSRLLSNPGVEYRYPALRADSLQSEPLGKPKNTGVGSLSLLQQISLTQELNRVLLHCKWILYQLSYQGSLASSKLMLKQSHKDTVSPQTYEWRVQFSCELQGIYTVPS